MPIDENFNLIPEPPKDRVMVISGINAQGEGVVAIVPTNHAEGGVPPLVQLDAPSAYQVGMDMFRQAIEQMSTHSALMVLSESLHLPMETLSVEYMNGLQALNERAMAEFEAMRRQAEEQAAQNSQPEGGVSSN